MRYLYSLLEGPAWPSVKVRLTHKARDLPQNVVAILAASSLQHNNPQKPLLAIILWRNKGFGWPLSIWAPLCIYQAHFDLFKYTLSLINPSNLVLRHESWHGECMVRSCISLFHLFFNEFPVPLGGVYLIPENDRKIDRSYWQPFAKSQDLSRLLYLPKKIQPHAIPSSVVIFQTTLILHKIRLK